MFLLSMRIMFYLQKIEDQQIQSFLVFTLERVSSLVTNNKNQQTQVHTYIPVSSKEPACQCRRLKRSGFDPWVVTIPWRMAWQPTRVYLPLEFHGQRRLLGYSPQGLKESDTTEATQHTQAIIISPGSAPICMKHAVLASHYLQDWLMCCQKSE